MEECRPGYTVSTMGLQPLVASGPDERRLRARARSRLGTLVLNTPCRLRSLSDIKDLRAMTLAVTSTCGCTGYRGRIDPRICALNALVYDTHFLSLCFLRPLRRHLGQLRVHLDPPACICQDQSFECLAKHAVASIALLDTHWVGHCHYQLNVLANNFQRSPISSLSSRIPLCVGIIRYLAWGTPSIRSMQTRADLQGCSCCQV